MACFTHCRKLIRAGNAIQALLIPSHPRYTGSSANITVQCYLLTRYNLLQLVPLATMFGEISGFEFLLLFVGLFS